MSITTKKLLFGQPVVVKISIITLLIINHGGASDVQKILWSKFLSVMLNKDKVKSVVK